MGDYLYFLHVAYGVRIHSFVLMGNHFHLIASFPRGNLSEAMNYFMRETSRVMAFRLGRINHIYGSRVFRSRLGSFHYFQNAYKYVYRNPVRAGLSRNAIEYPFSSLNGLFGLSVLPFPVAEDTLLFDSDPAATLAWLEVEISEDDREYIRKALRHPHFRLPKCRDTRQQHELETRLC